MSKSLSQLITELTEIHDKQRELALREIQIRQDILRFEGVRPVTAYEAPPSTPSNNGVSVSSNQTWNISHKIDRKVANLFRRTKHIMTNREVAEAIVEIEQNPDEDYRKFLIKKFSAVVGGKAKNGRTFKRIEIDGTLYYGLADWFEPNGHVKPEYGEIE